MLSEVRTRDVTEDQRGAWALPWAGASALAYDLHHESSVYPPTRPYDPNRNMALLPQPPNNMGPNVDTLYACSDEALAQLDGMPCGHWAEFGETGLHWLSAAPRSQHPGGVNVATVGGRVGFLSNNVDYYVMSFLVSINDGNVVNISEYVR